MSTQSAQPSTDGPADGGPNQDTVSWVLQIPPAEVVFVTAILEGYEGACLTTSLDREMSTLIIQVPSGQFELVKEVLDNIELTEGRIVQFPERETRREDHGTSPVRTTSNQEGDSPPSTPSDSF